MRILAKGGDAAASQTRQRHPNLAVRPIWLTIFLFAATRVPHIMQWKLDCNIR